MPVIDFTQAIISTLACAPGTLKQEFVDRQVPGHLLEVRSSTPGQGTWRYRQKVDGRMLHTKLGTTDSLTLAESRKKARALRAAYDRGDNPYEEAKAKKAELTLNELWGEYQKMAEPRKRSFARDEQLWRIRLQPKFGHLRLSQIGRHAVQSFHTSLKAEGLSGASADHHIKLLRRMMNLAVEWGMLKVSPLTAYKLLNEPNVVEHYLDEGQLQRLVTVLKTDSNRPVCLLCLFALASGCRLGEALGAQLKYVDRENRVWRIPAANSKSGKVRSVPLSDAALEVLEEIGTEGKYEYVFTNMETGTRYVHITHTWHRLRAKAGLPWLRFHDLRHTYASMLVNAGRSLYEVQQVLGHVDGRVTQRYAHLSSKTLQDAANSASLKIMEAMKQVP
jgi:integrase